MVRITISDLSPDDESKFINELTTWEMKTIYAGAERSYGRRQAGENTPEQTNTPGTDVDSILNRWMNDLEIRVQDLRRQLGISR
ncbi:hypothetical protein ACQFX9_20065 [Aliinostoc sp. HNIBRCY26]|uniref:hypothetical protein n=1 Tax=Aliinostoc sp. HNIBRCY26 TaxID=3418997 RepID=UPI003D01E768